MISPQHWNILSTVIHFISTSDCCKKINNKEEKKIKGRI